MWNLVGVGPRGIDSNPMFHVEHAWDRGLKRILADIPVEEDLTMEEAAKAEYASVMKARMVRMIHK